MDLFIFALVVVLTFTALAIERLLKDIREQNKEIILLLQKQQRDKLLDNTPH